MTTNACATVVALLLAGVSGAGAGAQDKPSPQAVEVTWTELQDAFYPAKSVYSRNRMSLLDVDRVHYDMEILWGWDRADFPENRIRNISGQIGVSEVPISSYSTLSVERSTDGYVWTIANKSYRLIARIAISDKSCTADVRYVLNPGQMNIEMLSMADERHFRRSAITTFNVTCKIGETHAT